MGHHSVGRKSHVPFRELHLNFKQKHAPSSPPRRKKETLGLPSALWTSLFPIELLEICLPLECADVVNTEKHRVAISQKLPLGRSGTEGKLRLHFTPSPGRQGASYSVHDVGQRQH